MPTVEEVLEWTEWNAVSQPDRIVQNVVEANEVLSRISYPRKQFKVDVQDGKVAVHINVNDNFGPGTINLHFISPHEVIYPCKAFRLIHAALHMILFMECHEAMEAIKIEDQRVFNPHTEPERHSELRKRISSYFSYADWNEVPTMLNNDKMIIHFPPEGDPV